MFIVDYSAVLDQVFTTGKIRYDVMHSEISAMEWYWIPPMVVVYLA